MVKRKTAKKPSNRAFKKALAESARLRETATKLTAQINELSKVKRPRTQYRSSVLRGRNESSI
jgi:hypothetical protein